MNYKQWIIKTFKRNQAVIVYVLDEAGRITRNWCIPERDKTVKIEGISKAVAISRDTMRLSTKWNIPTFFVHHSNCESMNLDDLRESYYTADEFRLILDNDEANKVFRASKNGALSNEGLIILVVVILGFISMFYFFNTKLGDIDNKIPEPNPIVEVEE